MVEQTLGILKPDCVERRLMGKVLAHLEAEGFRIRAGRLVQLSKVSAGAFYAVHRERPFFPDLVAFMTSGPCLALLLEREDAVAHLRRVIGATDPAAAAAGTIRKLYAENKQNNIIHASDSPENARVEAGFFFSRREIAELGG